MKEPGPDRDSRLAAMLERIRQDARVSYRVFGAASDLDRLVRDDIALLLSERFGALAEGPEPDPQLAAVPAPASPILGREAEVQQLEQLLTDPETRLVTLTGPGGVGKTRLATELAGTLAGAYPDGVRFVELSSVTAPDAGRRGPGTGARPAHHGEPAADRGRARHTCATAGCFS